MSWHETHQRSQVLHEVEAALAGGATTLPWRAAWGELLDGPDGLAAFARSRWVLRLADHGPVADVVPHPAVAAARLGLAALERADAARHVTGSTGVSGLAAAS